MILARIVLCIDQALVVCSALLSKCYADVKVSYPSYKVALGRPHAMAPGGEELLRDAATHIQHAGSVLEL